MAGTGEAARTPDAPRRAGPRRAAGPGRAFVVPAVLCALVLAPAVAGCAGPPGAADAAQASSAPGTRTPGTGRTEEYGGLNATDIGWIHLMIALDDQAVHILGLAPRRSADPALVTWAAGLAEDHRAALAALRGLLAEAGLPDDNPHEGHDLPGMVNSRELRALDGARGARFDRLLRSALREHLDQAVSLAASMGTADADPGVRAAARAAGRSAADARRAMPTG